MGITGLWPVLEPYNKPVTLESLEGKKLAVDVSIWIYQAQLGFASEVRCPHLALLINRLCKLLFYKIKPVFVFDGPDFPMFKKRVLEERRNKKLHDDITLSKAQKKHLEEFATGSQPEAEVLVKKIASPTKRNSQELFDLPSTSKEPEAETEVVEVSDDSDAEIIVEKEIDRGIHGTSARIDKLIDIREQIRKSRLNPHQIPKNTEEFCKFQLTRLLGRNKIDRAIKQLKEEHQQRVTGTAVRVAIKDSHGDSHVIKYDNDVQIIDPAGASQEELNSLDLTLEHILPVAPSLNITNEEVDELDDEEIARLADFHELENRGYVSKSSMIEVFMQRRIGSQLAASVRQDSWSSGSDDDDDDFIDVPDPEMPVDSISAQQSLPQPILTESEGEEKELAGSTVPNNKGVTEDESPVSDDWDPILKGDVFTSNLDYIRLDGVNIRERDPGAYKDLQDFLTACGFPWIEAPGEAEAQCVELERLGLVEGIVSDDSDVWAFGAEKVYRHLFARNKNVQFYEMERINRETGLSRADFIAIAMLSGGDYCSGMKGVGIVVALELLGEFAESGLDGSPDLSISVLRTIGAIEKWALSPQKLDPIVKRRKLRNLIKKNNEDVELQGLADPEIIKAYAHPNVNSSREVFRWRSVCIDKIRNVVYEKLGWENNKFSKIMLTSLNKWNEFVMGRESYQRHISSYVIQPSGDEQRLQVTRRVKEALQKLSTRRRALNAPSLICQASFADESSIEQPSTSFARTTSRRPIKRQLKKKGVPIKRKGKRLINKDEDLNLSETSDSDF